MDEVAENMIFSHFTSDRFKIQKKNGNIVSCSQDNSIKVWDIANGTCLSTLNGHTGTVWCVTELKNDNIVSCSADRFIKVWS